MFYAGVKDLENGKLNSVTLGAVQSDGCLMFTETVTAHPYSFCACAISLDAMFTSSMVRILCCNFLHGGVNSIATCYKLLQCYAGFWLYAEASHPHIL